MTQEEKQLLLKDLCARLPYHVMVHYHHQYNENGKVVMYDEDRVFDYFEAETIEHTLEEPEENWPDEYWKPYLRPMSSMTEEERDEIEEMSHGWFYVNEDGEIFPVGQLTDSGEFEDAILPTLEWLNKKMFDYRGLVPMSLALEAPDNMYKTK